MDWDTQAWLRDQCQHPDGFGRCSGLGACRDGTSGGVAAVAVTSFLGTLAAAAVAAGGSDP